MRIHPFGVAEPIVALSTEAVLALGIASDLIRAIQNVGTMNTEVGTWTA